MTTRDAFIAFLPVKSIDATHRFYHDVLGLDMVVDQGRCRIYQVTGGGYVGFCQRDDASGGAQGVVVTVVTDDVAGWHERLVAQGIDTDGAPRDNETYGIHHFFAPDPDGWTVEFQRFLDPAWATPLPPSRGG